MTMLHGLSVCSVKTVAGIPPHQSHEGVASTSKIYFAKRGYSANSTLRLSLLATLFRTPHFKILPGIKIFMDNPKTRVCQAALFSFGSKVHIYGNMNMLFLVTSLAWHTLVLGLPMNWHEMVLAIVRQVYVSWRKHHIFYIASYLILLYQT